MSRLPSQAAAGGVVETAGDDVLRQGGSILRTLDSGAFVILGQSHCCSVGKKTKQKHALKK